MTAVHHTCRGRQLEFRLEKSNAGSVGIVEDTYETEDFLRLEHHRKSFHQALDRVNKRLPLVDCMHARETIRHVLLEELRRQWPGFFIVVHI